MGDEYPDNDRLLDEFGFPVDVKKPAKVDPLPVVVVPNPFSKVKQEVPVTYSGKAEYKVKWREKNREHYLKKNREYVAAYRLRKTGKGY